MNQQISDLLRKPWAIPALVGTVSFSGGGALGYILGRRKINSALQEFADKILGEFSAETEEIEKKTEELRDLTSKLEKMDVVELQIVQETDEGTVVSILAQRDDDDDVWDYEVEKTTRTAENPYVIHRDEFFADEMGYTQSTVTYYSGDDILTDELDTPIYGHSAMVGELKFGHGSGDPTVVYIRSELLEHEYEVIQSYGRYEVEVLGHEIDEQYKDRDLKHSNVPKFKLD